MKPLELLHYFGAACANTSFLSFPTWYKYLQTSANPATGACDITITNISDVWLIVAAIIEILLRVGAILAIGFVIFGGFQYVTSQSEPEKLMKARKTIINALVGLVLAIMSATIVSFIARSIH